MNRTRILPSILPPLALLLALAPGAPGQETTRVSLTSTGGEANGACGTGPVHATAISSRGHRIAFVAAATDLVPGDTNAHWDVFVRDLRVGTTTRVSVSTGGAQGNDDSYFPRMCSTGRFVAFQGFSSTLVPGDTNGRSDVFVHDLTTGTTVRESVSTGGAQGNLNSESPSLSADGRWLAFWSNASNLVPGDTNGTGDIFLRDRSAGTTVRVSLGAAGGQPNGNAGTPYLSADGSTVAFESLATNLMPDTNGVRDVFVRKLASGVLIRAGQVPSGPQPNGPSEWPTLSADGRYVAFTSEASNLVHGDTNGVSDVFVQDLTTYGIERVSVNPAGALGNGASYLGWISADGSTVVFESEASDLVPGDTNGLLDVFARDRVLGQTRRISVSTGGGQASSTSFYAAPSYDASAVCFTSNAWNLVADDTNSKPDVFLRTDPPLPVPFCFGDNGRCPCGNGGGLERGCANSSGAGALLGFGGSTSVAADDLRLDARGLLPGQPALCFAGSSPVNGGAGAPFGDGLHCTGGAPSRLAVATADGEGDASFGPGLGALGGWSAGETRHFQAWYRDPAGGRCGSGFNLTNGLEVQFAR